MPTSACGSPAAHTEPDEFDRDRRLIESELGGKRHCEFLAISSLRSASPDSRAQARFGPRGASVDPRAFPDRGIPDHRRCLPELRARRPVHRSRSDRRLRSALWRVGRLSRLHRIDASSGSLRDPHPHHRGGRRPRGGVAMPRWLTSYDASRSYLLPDTVISNIPRCGSLSEPGAWNHARGILVELCRALDAIALSLRYQELLVHRNRNAIGIRVTACARSATAGTYFWSTAAKPRRMETSAISGV
jgi:hypothetical protein